MHEVTDLTGRVGFDYGLTPGIFGLRAGAGPLLVMPDTMILISLRQMVERETEGHFGLTTTPGIEDWEDDESAIRGLMALWMWHDVRFLRTENHCNDGRDRMSKERIEMRDRAVAMFQYDAFTRGGWELSAPSYPELLGVPVLHPHQLALFSESDQSRVDDIPSKLHLEPAVRPPGESDRLLADEALCRGAHVFLSDDRKVHKKDRYYAACGMRILQPAKLLEILDDSGELILDLDSSVVPDLGAIGTFYEGFG